MIDANNGIATTSITLVVTASVTFTFPAPPSGVVGTPYSVTLTAGGGTTPYTWSISAGSLPAGLTLNTSTGVVSGTPTLAGTSSFTAKVTDAKGKTATFATSITILSSMLTVAVSTSPATVAPGGTVTYTITATNSGQTALTGATFTDPLSDVVDDAAYNNDASATAGSVSFASPNLTWTGNLAVGASATITFSVTVNNPDTGNKTLASTITSATAGSNCASGSTDAQCSNAVTVLVPGLTTTVSAGTSTTTPGSVVQYTVTVTNSGQTTLTGATFTDPLTGLLDDAASPATATPGQAVTYTVTVTDSGQTPYTGATVTDDLSSILDNAVYGNDAAATTGTVSYASPVLTWTGNLAPGDTATITYTVTVNNPDTGNHTLASTLTSTTAGSNCPSGSTDPRCATSVSVAELTITSVADVSTTTPGGIVRFTGTFTNTGQVNYSGITITGNIADTFDDASPNSDESASSGALSVTSAGLTWTGSIPVGGTVTITGTVTVNNPDTGNKVLSSTLSTTAAGSNCPSGSTDPRCTVSVAVQVPALTITKTATTTTTTPGSTVGYTVTVTDSGQTRTAPSPWPWWPGRSPLPSRPPPAWDPVPPATRSVRAWAPSRSPTTAASAPTGPRRSRPPASPLAPALRPRPSPLMTPGTSSPRWPRRSARPPSPQCRPSSSAPNRRPSSAPPTCPGTPASAGIPPSR